MLRIEDELEAVIEQVIAAGEAAEAISAKLTNESFHATAEARDVAEAVGKINALTLRLLEVDRRQRHDDAMEAREEYD